MSIPEAVFPVPVNLSASKALRAHGREPTRIVLHGPPRGHHGKQTRSTESRGEGLSPRIFVGITSA